MPALSGEHVAPSARVDAAPGGRFSVGFAALLIFAAVAAYLPALRAGFIWDDDSFLTNNALIKAADGLRRFWFTTQPLDYWPVTSTTLWVEWRLWGMHAAGYHATNLALHVAESLLLWRIFRRLLIPGAWLGALLFAVHPVNVESVAWITQRKNMMAMLFFLLSVYTFLKSEDGAEGRVLSCSTSPRENGRDRSAVRGRVEGRDFWYWTSLSAFSLSMLSKGSAAMLPVALLGIVLWKRRPSRRDLIRLALFFVIGGLLATVNIWFEHHSGAGTIRKADAMQRLLGAGAAVDFYFWKALVPLKLAFVYPQWQIRPADARWWIPLALALCVTAVLWRHHRSWGRPWLFGWSYFCAMLVPVMGLTDVYFMRYSLVADHYQHFALLGVTGMLGGAWGQWCGAMSNSRARTFAVGVATVVVGALGGLTWRQCLMYRDVEALYSTTLETNPEAWLAHNNWGTYLYHEGKIEEAKRHFEAALRINSNLSEPHRNMGALYLARGLLPEAAVEFESALRIEPDSSEAHRNLASALAKIRKVDAVGEYEKALLLNPDSADIHNELGKLLSTIPGRVPEGIAHCEQALRLRPDFPEAENNLGSGLAEAGRLRDGIVHLRAALKLKVDFPEAEYNLGNALTAEGQSQEAVLHFEAALRLKPIYPEAHNNLGNILSSMPGRTRDAIAHYREALRLGVDDPSQAHVNLGRALILLGTPEGWTEAKAELEEALRISPRLQTARYMLGTMATIKDPPGTVHSAVAAYH